MKTKLMHGDNGQRTFFLIFDPGDEAIAGLTEFAKINRLGGSHFTAIGAFQSAKLGYFDWQKKEYTRIPVDEQVEVLSLVGDVAHDQSGEPKVHAHVVLGKSNGAAIGGHLLEGHVRPTLELALTESPRELQRRHDAETGLALIRI